VVTEWNTPDQSVAESVCWVRELGVVETVETGGRNVGIREGNGAETGIAAITHEREGVLLLARECCWGGGIGTARGSG